MAQCWAELSSEGTVSLPSCEGLIRSLLEAETTDRGIRSIRYQMNAAKFPIHRDLAGFEFEASPVDRELIGQLSELSFTEAAQNVVLVGGTDYAT